jgi:hypothetical protein
LPGGIPVLSNKSRNFLRVIRNVYWNLFHDHIYITSTEHPPSLSDLYSIQARANQWDEYRSQKDHWRTLYIARQIYIKNWHLTKRWSANIDLGAKGYLSKLANWWSIQQTSENMAVILYTGLPPGKSTEFLTAITFG